MDTEPGHPRVTGVVPVHNGVAHTRLFLASLSRLTYPEFRLTVVDDGSTDGTDELLAQAYPFPVKVIKGDGSLWWTRSVNLGVKDALKDGADYILTLNNDIEVEPDFLDRLMACSLEEGGAIVAPKILYSDDHGRVWSAAGVIRWYSGKLFYTVDDRGDDEKLYVERRPAEFIHAMGALVPAGVYEKAGYYDERYPQYNSDVLFSLLAKRKGFRLLVEPAGVIYNDAAHSRAMDIRKRLDLLSPLFDPYSPYDLRSNWRLYSDFAPNPAARVVGFVIKYLRFFLGTLRHL